jgi:hypothetical protein
MTHSVLFPEKERKVKTDSVKAPVSGEEISQPLHTYEQEVNTTEGSEYLDDALRMKEQPFAQSDTGENE